jgi:hypothetical protein
VWIQGQWVWIQGQWVWIQGQWVWIQGQWVWIQGQWVWIQGQWVWIQGQWVWIQGQWVWIHLFREHAVAVELEEEVAAIDEVEHEVQLRGGGEGVAQRHDVWVPHLMCVNWGSIVFVFLAVFNT